MRDIMEGRAVMYAESKGRKNEKVVCGCVSFFLLHFLQPKRDGAECRAPLVHKANHEERNMHSDMAEQR